MQFSSDTEIKRWKPKGNNTRARCGPKLYLRGFGNGRKLFQLRFDIDRKTNWLDVADYPIMSLAVAREVASAASRLIKAKDCTVETLKVALQRSDNAATLGTLIKAKHIDDQPVSAVPTFDAAYRAWYKLQLESNRWTNTASERRPIRVYELHAAPHIGTLPLHKIRRPKIKAFMQPLFTTTTEQASQLLGFLHEVFETAYDDEIIDGNPCPRKASFTIPKKAVRHAASLHYSRLPDLIEWLASAPFSKKVKVAMRLAIITAHRASVVSNMRWDHIDLDTGIWTIPERDIKQRQIRLMKSGRSFTSKLPTD